VCKVLVSIIRLHSTNERLIVSREGNSVGLGCSLQLHSTSIP